MSVQTPTRIGRPNREALTTANWRDDAVALLAERKVVRLQARALLPHARFVRLMADDIRAEQAQAGVIVFLEKLAGPKDDAA